MKFSTVLFSVCALIVSVSALAPNAAYISYVLTPPDAEETPGPSIDNVKDDTVEKA